MSDFVKDLIKLIAILGITTIIFVILSYKIDFIWCS